MKGLQEGRPESLRFMKGGQEFMKEDQRTRDQMYSLGNYITNESLWNYTILCELDCTLVFSRVCCITLHNARNITVYDRRAYCINF